MNGKMEGEYNGTRYRISFVYEKGGSITMALVQCPTPTPEGWTTQYSGLASLHPKDQHCRETGRKVALADALFDSSREFRTFIWGVYHGRKAK